MDGKIISTAPLGEDEAREPRLLIVSKEAETSTTENEKTQPNPAKIISMNE